MTRFWWDCWWVREERTRRRIGGSRDNKLGWGSRAVNVF